METRRYVFRRNGKIIGTYFAKDAMKRFGISKCQISKYAHSKKLLLGIYDVSIEGKEKPEFDELTEKEWKEEWDRVTRVLRERIACRKIIRDSWDDTVKPIRREGDCADVWRA